MQDFNGEESVLAGRDVIINYSQVTTAEREILMMTEVRHIRYVMRKQFLQVTLLTLLLLLCMMDAVKDHQSAEMVISLHNEIFRMSAKLNQIGEH